MLNRNMRMNIWDKHHDKLRSLLKKMRTDAGLTQVELAQKLGTHQGFISKYEKGERNLDFVEVLKVCHACGYPPEKLVHKFTF